MRSPLARFGTQATLLVVSIPLAFKASGMAAHGLGVALGFAVVCAALAAPLALDLWAKVEADRTGIRWRNRLITRRLDWADVAGFEPGPVSMVMRRTDGRAVPLSVLGLRYFGSKAMAAQRVAILERLRRHA